MYFVVADIHGFYSLTKAELSRRGFFDSKENKLILLGDALDRGDEPVETVDFLCELCEENRLIYVRGNHEDLFVDMLLEISRGEHTIWHHRKNGTWDSALKLVGMDEGEARYDPELFVRRARATRFYSYLLNHTVDYFETEHYIFTHGYIPCRVEGWAPMIKYSYMDSWREATADAWRSARWFNGIDVACTYGVREEGKTIVCGHFHTSFGHARISRICSEFGDDAIFDPFYSDGLIALDACTKFSGKINCLVIDD